MTSVEEYKLLEQEFAARTDALCENRRPSECDCSKCPCKVLCDSLCDENPHR